jgi:acyl-homoserine-lactone acylase
VLAAWELRDDLGSSGAILFRRFATRLLGNFPLVPSGTSSGARPGGDALFTQPFDASDPVHTPSGLNVASPLVQRALADAVRDLRNAGIPLGAPLRGRQFEERGGRAIPIHGGPGGLGVFNAIQATWDPSAGGFPDVPHGTSFIFAAAFEDGRCPVRAGTLLSYSLSENPQSPHAADYTRAFSRKAWHRAPFCEGEIRGDPNLTVKRISAPR